MLPIGMTPPANNAQSDARYIVASLKHVVRDIQEEFGRGSVHNMVISLEPRMRKRMGIGEILTYACLLTIVRLKNRDTFRVFFGPLVLSHAFPWLRRSYTHRVT